MLTPLFRLMATRPQLLAEHAEAYGELALLEFRAASAEWQRFARYKALGWCSLVVALLLAGVAGLLASALPMAGMAAPWALVVIPLVLAAAGVACLLAAGPAAQTSSFHRLRQQLQADGRLLRELDPA